MKTIKIFIVVILIVTLFSFIPTKSCNYDSVIDSTVQKYNPKRKDLIVLIDYNLGLFSKRLFVIDVKTKKIVLTSKVSHAFNSGLIYPTDLSNQAGTNKTCVGVFQTENTKFGKFGYSMIIKGLDNGVNNNAKNRNIIFHSNKLMKTYWSNGCFATDEVTNKKIIDLTQNGCLVLVLPKK